jgi:hypothetical protein
MTAYRFLDPAQEEVNEASSFYEAASDGLGIDFLADVQFGIDRLCEHPYLGHAGWSRAEENASSSLSIQTDLLGRAGCNPYCCRCASRTSPWLLENAGRTLASSADLSRHHPAPCRLPAKTNPTTDHLPASETTPHRLSCSAYSRRCDLAR